VTAEDALEQAVCLLTLGLAARYPWHPPGRAAANHFATQGVDLLELPLLILAGSGHDDGIINRVRAATLAALRGASITIVSGGTTTGVSALAGDVAAANEDATVIGYVPTKLPERVAVDDRYSEIRRTSGRAFGAWEPLRYWADVLASGLAPRAIRLIAVAGGPISSLEYRFALALGALVGVVRGSDGEAESLLRDTRWSHSSRLAILEPDEGSIRTFCELG